MNSATRSDPTSNDISKESVPWSNAIDLLRFQKRVCTTFIPKETNRRCCVCNYNHSHNDFPQSNETWKWRQHTHQEMTNCYGILPQSNRPYLRCDIETDLEQLCLVLFGLWKMVVPGLIMRMIGDTDTTPNIKIENELLQSISDAAVASDAWIITNGYKEESISELVGEVIYDCRMKNSNINFSAIGVGKWGNIHDCHKLEPRNSKTYKGHGRYKLELNHTHYIFFDDGTCDSLDNGEFASNLVRQISRGARRKIPLITVLAGGTLRSLSSIYTDLEKRIPIVVVNGCGPLANILYKYLKLTENSYKSSKSVNQKDPNEDKAFSDCEDNIDIATIDEIFSDDDIENLYLSTNKTLRDILRPLGKYRLDFVNDVRNLYNIIRQQEYETQGKRLPVGQLLNLDEEKTLGKYLYQMASCLDDPFRENIHFFNINSSKALKETIYDAFIQARDNLSQTKQKSPKTVDEQVNLALRWGIIDSIGNQSSSTTKIWNDTMKSDQNRLLLIDALSKNLLTFVMNFVKLDIDLTVLFGSRDTSSKRIASSWSDKYPYLQELYSDTKRKNRDPLYLLDQISVELNFTEEKHLVIILQKLVGDFMEPLYEDQSKSEMTSLENEEETKTRDVEYIYRDIFLWCILTCRVDMSKIFLSQMKSRICSALIASKILKSFVAYAPDQVTKDTLSSKADDFESHAIEFVRCAYLYDKSQACELIMRRLNLYGNVTCLQMAIAADNKKFLHEDACQTLLTNIWYDKVDHVREQNLLIINILTLGISQLFISIYQKHFFKYSQMKQENHMITLEQPKRELEKNGIDYNDNYDINGKAFEHFFHFHNRPIVKYCYTCFGYVLFLFLFSYYMLFAFSPLSTITYGIHWTEILTIITVTTMLFEEVRQFFSQDDRSIIGKIRAYFDLNNRISNLFLIFPAFVLFYIRLVLRFILKDPESFASARIVMALDLELWFIRSVLLIGIASNLGPKIVMIRKMTNDLLLFIIVIVIFIFGYGITSRSMTAYGTIDFSSRQIFRDIVYPVYFFVHGSFDNERTQLEAKSNVSTSIVTQIIFAFHMLFVNILLINLLIALFSFTINDIQTQARYVWAYDRCDIIRTYHTRPALFPPFTFLVSIGRCCGWCWRKLYRNRYPTEKSRCFKMIPANDNVDYAWSEFERYSTNSYTRQLLDEQANVLANEMTTDTISESSSTNADELKRIKSLISNFQDDLEGSRVVDSKKLETMKSTIFDLQTRFNQMETRCDRWIKEMQGIKTALNWMMTTMVNAKMNESEPPIIQETSRTNSMNQGQQCDTIPYRSNQQLNRAYTPPRKSSLQQERLTTSEVRIDMGDGSSKDDDV